MLVYKHRSCKGIFTQQLLTPNAELNAIQSMHADYFGLHDDTRIDSSPNASNQKIKVLEVKVTIHDSEQSLQTISPILNSEGTDTLCINQKAQLMSEQNQLSPDWVAGLEGETVICEDVTIRLSTSLPILEGCLDVYPECWRSIHLLDDGRDTPRASGHCMCDLHMHMYRYDRAEVGLTLFRSIRFQSHAVESQIR